MACYDGHLRGHVLPSVCSPRTAPGTGQRTNPFAERERTWPLPHGPLLLSQASSPRGRGLLQAEVHPSRRKMQPHSKDAPTEDPTLGWVEMEVKSRGPKKETEPGTELSKRNLVKKGGGDLRCHFWNAQGGRAVTPAQLWLVTDRSPGLNAVTALLSFKHRTRKVWMPGVFSTCSGAILHKERSRRA